MTWMRDVFGHFFTAGEQRKFWWWITFFFPLRDSFDSFTQNTLLHSVFRGSMWLFERHRLIWWKGERFKTQHQHGTQGCFVLVLREYNIRIHWLARVPFYQIKQFFSKFDHLVKSKTGNVREFSYAVQLFVSVWLMATIRQFLNGLLYWNGLFQQNGKLVALFIANTSKLCKNALL